jgi:hypothetical protein
MDGVLLIIAAECMYISCLLLAYSRDLASTAATLSYYIFKGMWQQQLVVVPCLV